jgi:hypothetical protein
MTGTKNRFFTKRHLWGDVDGNIITYAFAPGSPNIKLKALPGK